MNSWRLDCRYFLGDRPCRFKRVCEGCAEYSPMGKRFLIVKLGAIGDVLRTTPLLAGLKRAYPQSHITWVVDPAALPLLKHNPLIDRLLPFDFASLLPLSRLATGDLRKILQIPGVWIVDISSETGPAGSNGSARDAPNTAPWGNGFSSSSWRRSGTF